MSATLDSLAEQVARLESLLIAHLQEGSRKIPDRPMSPGEVAKICGKSLRTIKRWIGKGKLRAKKEGRTAMILPVDLQRFLGEKKEGPR